MEMEIIEFTVERSGQRLDKALLDWLPDYSRTQIQELIGQGHVKVSGQAAKPGNKLKGGERITITLPPEPETTIEPQDIPLNIRYEDKHIAVIEKAAGMVVHPGIAQEDGTLVNALLARYPELVDMQDDPVAEGRMGIVHRLDKDTSGLLVIARRIDPLTHLMRQFRERTVEKVYLALLERTPKTNQGIIDAPIGRDFKQRKRMGVRADGKSAQTEFEVIDSQFRDGRCLVRILIHTGRTHQIRVHMAFIGCPIVGDTVYGFKKQRVGLKRNFLHAAELAFDHPVTGERLRFTSELPKNLQNVMDKLRD